MNKIILIIVISVSAILNCFSQPNGGFENWHNEFSYTIPDDWQTMNYLSVLGNPLSAFKATGIDKHSGNYALKISTIFVNSNPIPLLIPDTAGSVFTGKIIPSPTSIKIGNPYTGRPEKFEFWAKCFPVGYDKGGVFVTLQKWNGTSHDTIAYGEIDINTTASYTFFQIGLNYRSTGLPDTLIIFFASSYNRINSRVGSTIFIDDFSLTGWVGIEENNLYADKVKLFPNPAKDNVNITAKIDEACRVKVTDALGKTAGFYKIQNFHAEINTSLFAEGIYFYDICDKNDKCLTRGKFNIVK